MTDQLEVRIRALVLGVVDSAPVPPTFDDIESGWEQETAVGAGQRRRRRIAVTVTVATALTFVGVVALAVVVRDTSHPRISTGSTTKAAKAKNACTLITTAEKLYAAHGRTTPDQVLDITGDASSCAIGPFAAAGASAGSLDRFLVTIDETVGPKAAAQYRRTLRLLSTGTTRLSGLPTGFVGVRGSPKVSSDAGPVVYVAYSKQANKLLSVSPFPTSSNPQYRPRRWEVREAEAGLRGSTEADSILRGLFMSALRRI